MSNCQSLNCSGPSERAKRRVAPRVMQSNAGGTASPDKTGGVVVLCRRHRPPADLHQRFPGSWLSNGGWNWRKRARERRMFCSTRSCALVKAGGVLRRSRYWRVTDPESSAFERLSRRFVPFEARLVLRLVPLFGVGSAIKIGELHWPDTCCAPPAKPVLWSFRSS